MISALVSKTIYQKRFMIFWWLLGLAAMTTFTMSFYNSFKAGGFDQTFNNLPKAFQKIAGNAASFKTISGYISQQIFSFRLPLLTIILSVAVFNSLSVGEERRGILQTQLTLPLTRTKILTSKLLSGLLVVGLASVGTFAGVLLGLIILHEHYSHMAILRQTLLCLLISFDFGLVAFMLGSIFGSKTIALGIAGGLAFMSYLISSLATAVPQLAGIEKLSLFHYYQDLANFSLGHTLVLLFVAVVLIVLSFYGFSRRDIKN